MKIGFTGTQKGMSPGQINGLMQLLDDLDASELHHGDCIGADAEADRVARAMDVKIVIHPPEKGRKRAYCFKPGDVELDRREYLQRNHDIVDATDVMIATPAEDQEQMRSGTWATVRYARRVGKKVIVIVP